MSVKFFRILFIFFILFTEIGLAQNNRQSNYVAGFQTIVLKDSTRIYKPNSKIRDLLHYRPVDLDIWYPSSSQSENAIPFGNLFKLFEERSSKYQEEYTMGLTEELAQYFAVQLGLNAEAGLEMLKTPTNSFENILPAEGKFPVIFYFAGYNGMGFENYKILETLAENGFVVVAIWSVGRFPGNMSNHKSDTLEQVFDAEFALNYLQKNNDFSIDLENIGILGCSWGGMSGAIFLDRNPTIKAMASLDGSEIFYYGDTPEEDQLLNEIYAAELIHPQKINSVYYYMESGDKWDEFTPTAEYNYFKKLNSCKKYIRFLQSKHEDFTVFPWLLNASRKSVKTYQEILESTTLFFNKSLQNKNGFDTYFKALDLQEITTTTPFVINPMIESEFLVNGRIIDVQTGAPLSYVNLGILGKSQGTVSSQDGRFELNLTEKNIKDTIQISSIGYFPKKVLVKNIFQQKRNLKIELQEQISQLEEIVIGEKGLKSKVIGNKTETKFINAGFSYDQLGAEIGIRMNIRKNPTFVDTFRCSVSQNRLSAKSVFRLNIYSISNGRPVNNLLKNNILIPIEPKQTGIISVDLKPYNIILKDDVIVTMEWIENDGQNKKDEAIFFSLGVLTGGTLHKESSQGKLKKLNGMGVGFTMDVRY